MIKYLRKICLCFLILTGFTDIEEDIKVIKKQQNLINSDQAWTRHTIDEIQHSMYDQRQKERMMNVEIQNLRRYHKLEYDDHEDI